MLKIASYIPIFKKYLEIIISIVQIITYIIATIIIIFGIFYSVFTYFRNYDKPIIAFYEVKTILGESISLSLSFILCVEILKLFNISNYKQLILVVTLVVLKLTVNYFESYEISQSSTDTIKRIVGQKKVDKLFYTYKYNS